MAYLCLSVFMSVVMILLFKWFERRQIAIFPAIVVNYYACLLTGWVLAPRGSLALLSEMSYEPWMLASLALGTLFITCFPLIGWSVQHNGAAATTIAGRSSMVLPVAAAVWLYADRLSAAQLLGIGLAVAAVGLTVAGHNAAQARAQIEGQPETTTGTRAKYKRYYWVLLPLTFVLNGIIEIVFNYAQKMLLPEAHHTIFTMSLFVVAGIIGSVVLAYSCWRGHTRLHWSGVLGGLVLGVPNYLAAYYFLQALSKSGWQSSVVIPLNNILVVLGTTLGTWLLFGERISRLNLLGMILASAAIMLVVRAG